MTEPAHDPELDYEAPEEVPGDRDNVDVPLALMNKATGDGEGDDDLSEPDFVSYASADAEEDDN